MEGSQLFRGGLLILLGIALVGGVSRLLGLGGVEEGSGRDTPGAAQVSRKGADGVAALLGEPRAEPCRVAQEGRPLPAEVHESSGVAVSRAHDGVLWTHNDSGEPLLYAVGRDGALAGRIRVRGARVEDWEDVALAPCPGGDCLYVGDIGDNEARRRSVTVYRVREPAAGDRETAPAEAFHARYPDGPHDAEAMFVLPGGEIYLLTKGETGPITLYRFPVGAQPGSMATLERVREFASDEVERDDRVTGADASPDGRWIAVRTLNRVSLYAASDFLGGGAHPARRMDLSPLKEAQGEGVGFGENGLLALTSEGGKKKDAATFAMLQCDLQ